MTQDTIANILRTVSDLRGESAVNEDAVRIRACSNTEQDFARRRMWTVHLLRNQTIAGDGTNDYEIGSANYPMRLKGLSEVFVGGQTEDKRVIVVNYFDYQEVINADSTARVAYEYYDAANDKWMVHINPAPATGETIYYSYFYMPVKKTLTTEYIVCPNLMYIVKTVMAYLADGDDETERAMELRQEAELAFQEMNILEDMTAINMETSFKKQTSRGIGTY